MCVTTIVKIQNISAPSGRAHPGLFVVSPQASLVCLWPRGVPEPLALKPGLLVAGTSCPAVPPVELRAPQVLVENVVGTASETPGALPRVMRAGSLVNPVSQAGLCSSNPRPASWSPSSREEEGMALPAAGGLWPWAPFGLWRHLGPHGAPTQNCRFPHPDPKFY